MAGLTEAPRTADYNGFAWFYNRYLGARYHAPALAVLDRILFPHVPAGGRVLDLCCGTGHLASRVAERGYHITGIDLSEDMLVFARRNVPGAEFIAADARQFRLPAIFDGALSTFESLNHMLTIPELASVFRNVFVALRAGGIFVFDLLAEDAYRTQWNQSAAFVEEDNAYFIRGGYDAGERLGRTEITAFRRVGGWVRTDLRFFERYHPPEAVLEALRDAGFGAVRCSRADTELGMEGELACGRLFFEARKP